MPKLTVYNMEGAAVGEQDLSEAVFAAPVNKSLLHQAVVRHLTNQRVGSASTRTRAEVRGGGRKPWRQKGLGRARHGTIRSPIWKGGGVAFGPKPREYEHKMPTKARRVALRSALSAKADAGEIVLVDELSFTEPKTREMKKLLENLEINRKVLIVISQRDVNVEKSARNLPGVKITLARLLNVYDVLSHDFLLMTKDAVSGVEEVLAG